MCVLSVMWSGLRRRGEMDWGVGMIGRRLATAAFALLTMAFIGSGCAGGGEQAANHATRAPGVTLDVQVHHEGLAIFRSPTFRCGEDYCAGAVLYDVSETLRPERDLGAWSYSTAARPDGESVEIRFKYDPTVLSMDRLVAVMKEGMEKSPDPRHPGPVRVRITRVGAGVDSGSAK